MRKVYYQLARETKVAFLELHVTCTLENAIRNNEARTAQLEPMSIVNEQTIRNVASRMEPPVYSSHLMVESAEIFDEGRDKLVEELLSSRIGQHARVPPPVATADENKKELT